MRVRRAAATDIAGMMRLERSAQSVAHWPLQLYEKLFSPDEPSVPGRLAWIVEGEDPRDTANDLLLSLDEAQEPTLTILGFLIARKIDSEWELENIVVATDLRRQKLGTRLLSEFLTYVREAHGSRIFLEVRESNFAARSLYEKFFFRPSGVRKNYYFDPAEDAFLYDLRIN
jgi:ribosomal-protein-alanine acetyltransferase